MTTNGESPAPVERGASWTVLARLIAEGQATPPAPSAVGPIPMPPTLGDPTVDVAAELVAARREERW